MNTEREILPPTEEEVYEALGLQIDVDGSTHTREEIPPPTADTTPHPTALPGDLGFLMKRGYQLLGVFIFVLGFGIMMDDYKVFGRFEAIGVIAMGIGGFFLLVPWLMERH